MLDYKWVITLYPRTLCCLSWNRVTLQQGLDDGSPLAAAGSFQGLLPLGKKKMLRYTTAETAEIYALSQ